MAGVLADAMAMPGLVMSQIGNVFTQIGDFMGQLMRFNIIAIIIIIGKCIFSAIMFVVEFFIWIFEFLVWLIMPFPLDVMKPKQGDEKIEAGFIPWLIRYIIVIVYKIINIPKCFIWYFIDTACWTIYLPFRFIFWMLDSFLGLGIVKAEHDAWDFMDQIDYFIHGKPLTNWFMYEFAPPGPKVDKFGNDPDTLQLGLHIIHFPDSVMRLCYSISPYRQAKLKMFPIKAFMAFIKCAMNPFG